MIVAKNPYAPPVDDEREGEDEAGPYWAERRSVAAVVALYFVTCGLYGPIWFLRRQKFLDSLDSERKIGSLPIVALVLMAISVALSIALSDKGADRLPTFGGGIIMLIMSFRTAEILRNDFARTGRLLSVSGVAVFFLGPMYLQHKINEAADTPARLEEDEPRPKKKRKKKPAEAPQETSAE